MLSEHRQYLRLMSICGAFYSFSFISAFHTDLISRLGSRVKAIMRELFFLYLSEAKASINQNHGNTVSGDLKRAFWIFQHQ